MAQCKPCHKIAQKRCYDNRTAKNIAKREGKVVQDDTPRNSVNRQPLHDIVMDLAGEPSKECCRCGEIKSVEDFYSDISKATGESRCL